MKKEIYLVLDNIRSRENVGSIFRSADAVGVRKIYLCGITPVPPHPKISKAALGAEIFVPWEYYRDCWRLLTMLKDKGFEVLALELRNRSENIFEFKFPNKCVLLVGNEVRGLSSKILRYADNIIAIPMYGCKESLNVAVATGIAIYQIRQEMSFPHKARLTRDD